MIRIISLYLLILTFSYCTVLAENKRILIKKITLPTSQNFESVSAILEAKTKRVAIATQNWAAFPYAPKVDFRIAHDSKFIVLKFYVNEQHLRAKHNTPNAATHRDSCVEFFFDPQQNGNYYNFEFNCIGTTHLAYGANRHKRKFIPPKLIEQYIKTWPTLGNQPFENRSGAFEWEMIVIIDTAILIYENNMNLNAMIAKANFYKCGDATAVPHYLSWHPIKTEHPDFHRPEYFGELVFE